MFLGASCRAPAGSVATGAAPALETRSNILRADYVGSAACAGCHADVYARWAASPMRNMTRDPEHAAIRAPFAGETFTFKGDQATFFRAGSARLVRIAVRDESEHLYRVTRVIGNRHREDFAGVEVASPEDSVERGTGPELILPVTYYFQTHGYRPKGYSVMAHERPGLRSGAGFSRGIPSSFSEPNSEITTIFFPCRARLSNSAAWPSLIANGNGTTMSLSAAGI